MSKKKNKQKNENTTSEEVSNNEELLETEIVEEVSQNEKDESIHDQLVRLQADFTNFRNRTQRERIELYQRANEDLLLEILPVLDHFEMGLETAKKHNTEASVIDGFTMVLDQFQKVLDQFKLNRIDVIGKEFDPHLHEALTHMPSEDFSEGLCINQIRSGYLFGDKLLRAAQVVVSSGKDSKKEK